MQKSSYTTVDSDLSKICGAVALMFRFGSPSEAI